MPKDPGAPAARHALKYKPGAHPGGGLPAADLTADQAHDWYTAAQVAEALGSGSHALVDDPPKAAAPSDPDPAAEAAPKESE
jgi:hypothetical protein